MSLLLSKGFFTFQPELASSYHASILKSALHRVTSNIAEMTFKAQSNVSFGNQYPDTGGIGHNVFGYGSLPGSGHILVRVHERYAIEPTKARALAGNELYPVLAAVLYYSGRLLIL